MFARYNQNMAESEKNTKVNDDLSKARAYAVCFFGGLFIVVFFLFADDWLTAHLSTDPVAVERIARDENARWWLRLPFRMCQIGGGVYMATAAILEVRRRLRLRGKL